MTVDIIAKNQYFQLAKYNFIGNYYPFFKSKKVSEDEHKVNIKSFQLIYESIIFQMPNNSSQYPKNLMDIIINSVNGRKFSLKNILDLCNKDYIYYNDIFAGIDKNIHKYFIKYSIDFTNIDEITEMYFDIYYQSNISKDILKKYAKKFKERNLNINSLVIDLHNENYCILCINTSKFNLATVYHQFLHILQYFFNILFLKDINYNIPTNKIFNNIPQKLINEIFQKHEIIPNITVFCLNIEDLNNSNYNNMIEMLKDLFFIIQNKKINNFNIYIKKFIDNKFSINGLLILYLSFQESNNLYIYLKNFILSYIDKLKFF